MGFTIETGTVSISSANDFLDAIAELNIFMIYDGESAAHSGTWAGVTLAAAGASSGTVNVKRMASGDSYDFQLSIPSGAMTYTAYEGRSGAMFTFEFESASNNFALIFDHATNLASGNAEGVVVRSGSAPYSPMIVSGGEFTNYANTNYLTSPTIVQIYPLVQACGCKAVNACGVLRSNSEDFVGLVTIDGSDYFVYKNTAFGTGE